MIRYSFAFADGSRADFQVDELAPAAQTLRSSEGLPSWMDLDMHRCPHCPLPCKKRLACPAMEAIVPTIECFGQRISSDTCDLMVEQKSVTHQAHTSIQNAARSLIGLQLACRAAPPCTSCDRWRASTSHCPTLITRSSVFSGCICSDNTCTKAIARLGSGKPAGALSGYPPREQLARRAPARCFTEGCRREWPGDPGCSRP